jgi:hypothetical protein
MEHLTVLAVAAVVALVLFLVFLLLSDGDLSLRFNEKFGKRLGKLRFLLVSCRSLFT